MGTPVDFARNHQTRPDAGAQNDGQHGLFAPGQTKATMGDDIGIHVIVDPDRQTDALRDDSGNRHVRGQNPADA